MKFKSLAAALALVATAPVMATTCTNTFTLGSLGPPALAVIGNGFESVQHFDDCYNFTLSSSADSFGFMLGLDASYKRDIDIKSLSLLGNGFSMVDSSPNSFSFNNLLSGTYQLIVSGDVTGKNGGLFGGGLVGYLGFLETSRSVAAPVPEPETYAMLLAGLGVMAWVARRRKRA